jgi:M6 family metalloprotease-like protein
MAGILTSALVVSVFMIPAGAAPKIGSSCLKIDSTQLYEGKKLICSKVGKSFKWKVSNTNLAKPIQPTPAPSTSPKTSKISNGLIPFQDSQVVLSTYENTNSQNCKLPTIYPMDINQNSALLELDPGFPKSPKRLPSEGTINAVMLFVDFIDIQGNDNPQILAKTYTDIFESFYEENTYGKLKFKFTVPDQYFHIHKESSAYGMQNWNEGNPAAYLQDAVNAAIDSVDFSNTDVIYVIPPKGIKTINYGPALPAPLGISIIHTNQKDIYSGAVAGSDATDPLPGKDSWIWLAHETGHLFGMMHPYFNVQGPAPYWDLMFWNVGAPGFYGWNRFVQGWITDSQVICLDPSNISSQPQRYLIAPIDAINSQFHIAIIPTSKNTAIAIENRRKSNFDQLEPNQEGLVIYRIDTSRLDGHIFPVLSGTIGVDQHPIGTYLKGQSVQVDGYTLTNIGKYLEGDVIQIQR